MAERMTIYCDGCGKAKGEANHWHKAGVFYGAEPRDATAPRPVVAMLIGDVEAVEADGYVMLDFCGEKCLHEYAQALIQAGA